MNRSALRGRIACRGKPSGTVGRAAKSGGSSIASTSYRSKNALRRLGRAVRLREAAGEEERLVLVLAQQLDRAVGGACSRRGARRRRASRSSDPIARLWSAAVRCDGSPRSPAGCAGSANAVLAARRGAEAPHFAAFGPGLGVVDAAVEDLAGAQRRVAVVLEAPRQADEVGMAGAEPGAIAEHAGRRSGSGR